MEKDLNLVEILKNCPKGTKLYSPMFGEVELCIAALGRQSRGILVTFKDELSIVEETFHGNGKYYSPFIGECMLFPSKDQRDWSKFVTPKPDLPKGTWVMCEDNIREPIWGLYRYKANAVVALCLDEGVEFSWKYIIPLNKFDPDNIEECIKKYNYGTQQN